MPGIVDVLTFFGRDRTRELAWGLDDLLAVLEAHGVERALTLSLRAVYYAGPQGNDETRDACARHQVLEPVAVLDPRRWFDCREEAKRRMGEGFRVFRFFPELQGWSVAGANFLKICERIAELGGRIIVSAGGAGQPTQIARGLAEMALPTLLTGAGYSTMGEVMAVLEDYPHMHTEAHVMDTPGAIEALMQVGESQVMFGSNSPERYLESPLLMAQYADLTDAQRDACLRGNALAFLGEERA
ncbi:MAG TPA: amidohydrolase family protein [Armatimonadota bacterium]|nr:amidohydrolase family protein [Armatimonadota bacterium]